MQPGFRDSIFVKLLWIYLATVLLVVALVLSFLKVIAPSGQSDRATKDRNRAMYVGLLADRFGSPPRLDEARRFADSLDIQIRMEGPSDAWSTWEGLPPISQLKEGDYRPTTQPNARFGLFEGRPFTVIQRGGNTFLFFFRSSPFRETRVEWIPVLIGLVVALLFLSYMLVRRLFRPLGWLMEGVREAAGGNLDHRVAGRGRDELALLAKAFNDMTGRIGGMIRAREQLLLDVSHELKTPITRIKLAIELGRENCLAVVKRNVGEMETMVSELLETARLDSGAGALSLESMDVGTLIRDAAASFQDARPGISVVPVLEGLALTADGKRAHTVLRNLIENALKYSAHQDRPVEVGAEARPEGVAVTVRDYGFGIPEADQASVFDPFYRVDKSRNKDTGGYGLGLSLCKKIMEAHGGAIELWSVEGQGTRVTALFKGAAG